MKTEEVRHSAYCQACRGGDDQSGLGDSVENGKFCRPVRTGRRRCDTRPALLSLCRSSPCAMQRTYQTVHMRVELLTVDPLDVLCDDGHTVGRVKLALERLTLTLDQCCYKTIVRYAYLHDYCVFHLLSVSRPLHDTF